MGLMLSAIISYAGALEAIETMKYIANGMLPETDPDFSDLVDYYRELLQRGANAVSSTNWTQESGQGYLCLTQDEDGKLSSAAVKYYDGQPNSTAILFSTKISSFGQDSVDSNTSQQNGDCRTERYTPTTTKTIITNTSESVSVGYRNRSPTSENISDPNRFSESSFERDPSLASEGSEAREKLKWHYRPLSPAPQTLPEIHFQSSDGEKQENDYSEDFLRSLDGIKFRPLQRSDPSGRRRSFKKRHSSSSTSSRESRASREEELKMFSSLEEAEFERMNKEKESFGSSPNLAARSHSRSRSRENSKERRNESWSADASVESVPEEDNDSGLRPQMKNLPKLGSFEEEKEEPKETKEVTEEEEDIDDFWGSGD